MFYQSQVIPRSQKALAGYSTENDKKNFMSADVRIFIFLRKWHGVAGWVRAGATATAKPYSVKGGSWLACDAGTSVYLTHRGACIAGKPAPTEKQISGVCKSAFRF
nr:hypothetical protein [Pseudomonas edaphica]